MFEGWRNDLLIYTPKKKEENTSFKIQCFSVILVYIKIQQAYIIMQREKH